jgi:hypothetical protein
MMKQEEGNKTNSANLAAPIHLIQLQESQELAVLVI